MDDDVIDIQLNNDLERRIADAFLVFDMTGQKIIETRDVGNVIRGLGCCPTEAEVQEIIMAVEDHESPGRVPITNFVPHVVQIITEHRYQPVGPEQLIEAFRTLDGDGHGYLEKDFFSKIMTENGEPFTEEELEEMMEIAVDPQTGVIPYEYYTNQLMVENKGDDSIYTLADRVEADKPPPPPPTRQLADFLKEQQSKLE